MHHLILLVTVVGVPIASTIGSNNVVLLGLHNAGDLNANPFVGSITLNNSYVIVNLNIAEENLEVSLLLPQLLR